MKSNFTIMGRKFTFFRGSLLISFAFMAIVLISCNKDNFDEDLNLSTTDELELKSAKQVSGLVATNLYTSLIEESTCGSPMVVSFLAGQHINAGTVTVANTLDKVYVTISTTDGWEIGLVHLYVGDLAGVPVNKKGNPMIGNFPNNDGFEPYVQTVVYEFDAELLDDCFIVAAHAEVHNDGQSETAWGEGSQFVEKGSWASYFDYCKQECPVTCGTPMVVDLLAGQYIEAGTVTIENTSDKLTVTITSDNGWEIGQVHLYVGSLSGVPANKKGNPVIGNFPINEGFANYVQSVVYEFDTSGLDDCFIVAAHAEVHNNGQSETAWGDGAQFNVSGSWATYTDYCLQSCPGDVVPR